MGAVPGPGRLTSAAEGSHRGPGALGFWGNVAIRGFRDVPVWVQPGPLRPLIVRRLNSGTGHAVQLQTAWPVPEDSPCLLA
jgi:hypothetical protein